MKKQNFRIVVGLLVLVSLGALNFRHAHEGYGVRLMDKAQAQSVSTFVESGITLLKTIVDIFFKPDSDYQRRVEIPRKYDCQTKICSYYIEDPKRGTILVGRTEEKCGRLLTPPHLGGGVCYVTYEGDFEYKNEVSCIGVGKVPCTPKIWSRSEVCACN